jgi:tetratricopeptide (TPR) repeat protein
MNRAFIYIPLFLFLLSSCASAPVKTEEAAPPSTKPVLTKAEAKSLEVFNQILALPSSSEDMGALLKEKERLYKKIITDYPETPLAQESYWRLIASYVNDYAPPNYEKAEFLYAEFLKKHPNSAFKGFADEELGKSYYLNKEWRKLADLSSPVFRDYLQTGRRPAPLTVYFYAESNFNLGNYKEAEEGFKEVLKLFPKLSNAEDVRSRLDEIMSKKNASNESPR